MAKRFEHGINRAVGCGLKARVVIAWANGPGTEFGERLRAVGPRYAQLVILTRMSQSLSFLLVHIIFSTKDRKPWLNDTIRPEMHAYLASAAGTGENYCFRVGGVEDHVHVAVLLARNATVAKLVEQLKVSSSKWIKTKSPEFERFRWQKGYAAFSVGPSDREALLAYIDAQATHHQRRDYQAEMRALFTRYGVAFDERFVWD